MSENLEKRQFMGITVNSNNYDEQTDLIEVKGILYRYVIMSDNPKEKFDKSQSYDIISSDGNTIIIQATK